MKLASDIFTRIRDAMSSQNREAVMSMDGPISLKSSSTVSGVSGKFIVIALPSETPTPHI